MIAREPCAPDPPAQPNRPTRPLAQAQRSFSIEPGEVDADGLGDPDTLSALTAYDVNELLGELEDLADRVDSLAQLRFLEGVCGELKAHAKNLLAGVI